ncbi:MAG: bacterial Ig-like domain-containing protein [Treponema sp.]|jgi:hypothetical protein|nr:bacterial Ig-like domain-containing protein [Treponema sp.]
MKRFFYFLFLTFFLIACENPFYDESYESPDDVVSITVTPPLKRLYKYGEPFDRNGLNVKVFRRNGTFYDEKTPVVSGFDSTREGIQTITVSTGGKSYQFDVGVMLFALNPEGPEISISKGGTITLKAESGIIGSWTIYVFKDSAFESVPRLDPKVGSSVAFAAPSSAGTYVVAASFRLRGVTSCRFYLLRVTE